MALCGAEAPGVVRESWKLWEPKWFETAKITTSQEQLFATFTAFAGMNVSS
jgi:hypothetical protein